MVSQAQQIYLEITGFEYRMSGTDVATPCPFCGETRYKFGMSPEGFWNCFICNTKGRGLVSFIQQYEGCSSKEAKQTLKEMDYHEANSFTQEYSQSQDLFESLLDIVTKPSISHDKTMPALPKGTKKLLDNMYNPEAYPFFNYIWQRHITPAQLARYDIRYCTLGTIKHEPHDIPIKNSLVFITYENHKPVYWNTRSIEKYPFIKSINAPATNTENSKNNSVFNLDSVTMNSVVVWTEGVFNAMSCEDIDDSNLVPIATFGKKITDQQIDKVLAKKPALHYLFLDNDAKSEEYQLIDRLYSKNVPLDNIYIVNNPYGNEDANDLGRDIVADLLYKAEPLTRADLFYLKLKDKLGG